MSWLFLILAGIFEIGFTTAMRLSDGFSRLWPTVLFVLFATLSFVALQRSLRDIPLGTAYAVWTGIGAAGTFLVGIVLFQDTSDFVRIFLVAVLIASIIGLKLFTPH